MFLRKVFYMEKVRRTQWRSHEEIERLQFHKFQQMVRYAYENVEFYRKKFDAAGVKPEDIKTRDDIARLPVTTKKEVFDVPIEQRMSKLVDINTCRVEGTSGSSGMKLTVAISRKAKDFCDCVYGRALFALGYKPWESMAYFWPQTAHRPESHESFGLMGKDWICSHIRPEEQLDILVKLKPRIIYAFPSLLSVIAKIVEKEGREKYPLFPELIICHAELLHPETRAYIESVFKVPVYNEYGATEFGFRMAWECQKREGMHIDADSVLIEFLDGDRPVKPGERGEMVITGLVNDAMPLIRYKIGDIGVPSDRKCSCGRGLPLMERLEGRNDDFVTLPSGKILSPRVVVPIIEKSKQVGEFRFIQNKVDEADMLLVAPNGITPEQIKQIEDDLLEVFQEDVKINSKVVEHLERNDRGKLRAVLSYVK